MTSAAFPLSAAIAKNRNENVHAGPKSGGSLAPTTVGGTPTGPHQGPGGTLEVGSEAGTSEGLT